MTTVQIPFTDVTRVHSAVYNFQLLSPWASSPRKTATRSRHGWTATPTATRPRKCITASPSCPWAKAEYGASDHDLLEHVKFPPIQTLDTSKTPKAGDTRIHAPVLVSADLAKITRQIQAIQVAQGSSSAKKRAPREPQSPLWCLFKRNRRSHAKK